MNYFKTKYPMRADQISYKIFNDVKFTQDLIRVNKVLKETLIVPENTIILIPNIKNKATNKGLNLWS